jgi:crotonobetainyl-CoA:carnitine CoA-transferase CaiB-like acyl-CoA transferase
VPWLATRRGSEPPHYAPVNLADRLTGLHAVYAVTAALFQRERTGKGQAVEVPMFESVAHFVLGDHLAGYTYEPPIAEAGYARLLARKPYRTRDGYLCILVYNDKQWKSFLEAVGEPERMNDPRFATQAGRARHISEIYEYLAGLLQTRTTGEWIALLEAVDIPVAPMNSIEDVVRDPHLAASGFFTAEQHPSEGAVRGMRTPTRWSAGEAPPQRPAPRLGEHSAEILREAGYSQAQIDDLVRRGVTRLAPA